MSVFFFSDVSFCQPSFQDDFGITDFAPRSVRWSTAAVTVVAKPAKADDTRDDETECHEEEKSKRKD